jgi:glycosyltransferase involved in cell wall biosynthesis
MATIAPVDVVRIAEEGWTDEVSRAHQPVFRADLQTRRPWVSAQKWMVSRTLTRDLSRSVNVEQYDLIFGRYLRPIVSLRLPESVPTLIDLDDLGYRYGSGQHSLHRLDLRLKSTVRHLLEWRAMGRFSAFCFVSERDRGRHPGFRGEVVPNIPLLTPDSVKPPSRGTNLLFVANYRYPPNRDGLLTFLRDVWPHIRSAVPTATLGLAGRTSPDDRSMWNSVPGVKSLGFVPKLDLLHRDCAFAIAPIFAGGGTNIKVLEALGHRRTCVVSHFSLAAFAPHLSTQREVLAGRNEREFAQQCVRLLRDPALRHRLECTGAETVRARFSRRSFHAALERAVDLALTTAPRPHHRARSTQEA